MGYLMVRPRVWDDEEAGLPEGMPGLMGYLMVRPRVWDDEEAGLPEGRLDLIGESTGCEAPSDGRGPDVAGELQASALRVGPS